MAGHLDALFAIASSLNSQGTPPVVLEGILQAGSYDPTNGTVQVAIGHTVAAASFDDGDQPMIVTAALATIGYGDQYGPVGNERALVFRAGTHFIALIEFGPDDSPGAPTSERWVVHRNPQTGEVDVSVKWTKDGPTEGDGLGGFVIDGGALLSYTSTSGDISIVANDTEGTFTITCGENQIVLTTDPTISLIPAAGGGVGLGAADSTLTSAEAAFNQTHISNYDSNLQMAKLDDYIKYANLMFSSGAITSGQLAAMLAALVSGWTHGTTIPGGSSVVKMIT